VPRADHSLIALTGFMGSGKSSVGRALASLLGWSFVDLDGEIEREQGRKIREIFAGEGEAAFREIESVCLREVAANVQRPVVLATGGGTFVQSANAELLRAEGALVVFIHATPETLLNRCSVETGEQGVRPLAQNRDEFMRLYEQRLPVYRTANFSVNSDGKSPEAVAREVVDLLNLATKAGSSLRSE